MSTAHHTPNRETIEHILTRIGVTPRQRTMCCVDFFLAVLALLFPPLPVWVKRGICSADSLINLLLLALGYVPGLIHSWYIICKYPEPEFDYDVITQDAEALGQSGRITYVVVQQGGVPHTVAPRIHENMSYGTSGAPAVPSTHSPAVASSSSAHPPPPNDAGEGRSDAPPPSYAQAVADNKIQTQD